ncbi:hypothetical protein LAZ67_9000961 [Cordylochernes scorpioides]|uniref:Reverse transcriptase domain-containing protein n=1 Tax=Cordylochernes scorpioides TaxID=51811 RepID=A0ABY6KSR2_9ARAC|nr:hypothetical protein LAZ67_9000961 [Cordylochernes scorpioides]
MNIANEMLDSVRDDPNLLQRVITGDETWVYGHDVETKAQSSQWKLPHEPRPKKARQVRSKVKVLLTVFFDCRGVVHQEFFPQGRTVNKEYYLQVMRNLREAIRQKRPDLWKNKNWLLHHDNAPAHTSLLVRDFLAKNNTLMMPRSHRIPQIWPPGNPVEGESLRHTVYNSYRERFDSTACSPEAITGFLQGATESINLEDSDPLHRADISLSKVETAFSRLPQVKAAGWDSVSCELVKGFENLFVGAIHRVILESKLRGALPESSRRSIICLVPEEHGGPGLSGYRPISLPTADYRIVGGILQGRLRRHLPVIVPECQTYAVPGRCPSWNLTCVSDNVALAVKIKSPLAVISTDLQTMWTESSWPSSCAPSACLRPSWNGFTFSTRRPMLLSRSMETSPVHSKCAKSSGRRALGRGNVLAYADDILLLIREDWQFEKFKTIFDEFRRASGVCVNFTKSKGLWCGTWRDRADSPLGISWSSSSITVLGCEVTSGQGTSVQENHLLGILERAISRWSPYVRGFSLVGRARAANSLVLAAVLHHLHGYLPCDATIAKLQARLTRVGGVKAYSWLVESGVWKAPMSSGAWLPPRRRRLLELLGAGLLHPGPESPRCAHSHPSEPTSRRCLQVPDDAIASGSLKVKWTALVPFCRRLVAENAERRMLKRPRLAAVPISRYLRRWAPVVDVPSTSLAFSSLRRCSFGGHAADITLRLALHALPHPGHPASSQPVCIACGSSDLSLAHRYWTCSAVRPLIREVFSIIGRPPDLQSWIFAVGLEDHDITISSAAKCVVSLETQFGDIHLLLYADDIAIIGESRINLQKKIKILKEYLDENLMTLNESKSKIMVFRNGGKPSNKDRWFWNDKPIAITSRYTYLGFPLTPTITTTHPANYFKGKALTAINATHPILIKSKAKSINLSIKLFDTIVRAVLMYAAPLWATEHKDLLDNIQDIFIRRFLNLPRYTPGYLIRLETGRISLSVTALKLTLKYWLRVLNMSSDRLPRICFNRTRELSNASGTPIGFIKKLTNLLNDNGSPALVSCDDPETLRSAITGLLKTAADQSIQNDLTRMDKSKLYSHYKDIHISFMTEGYLLGDFPFPVVRLLAQVRILSSFFRENHTKMLCGEDPTCTFCNSKLQNEITHYIFDCSALKEERRTLMLKTGQLCASLPSIIDNMTQNKYIATAFYGFHKSISQKKAK